jgi:competence ComEA-like helix-hairpin-helix protein
MSELININTADLDTLATLPGIGQALAQRIMTYRETVHAFAEVIELTAVPGISEKMVRSMADQITVGELEGIEPPAADEETSFSEDEVIPEPVPEVETAVVDEIDVSSEVESEAETMETAVPAPLAAAPEPAPFAPGMATPTIEETPPPSEPEPAPEAETPAAVSLPPEWESRAQRRGCFSVIFGALLGAFLGLALTLAVIGAINDGTLTFSQTDAQLRSQLNTEIISRTSQLNEMATHIADVATQQSQAEQRLSNTLGQLEEDLGQAQTELETLAETAVELETRVANVAGAADIFSQFLDGLRSLLEEIGPSVTDAVTPSPPLNTSTPLPTNTPIPNRTPESTATAVPPTRTPQPTATPLSFATSTPAQQP